MRIGELSRRCGVPVRMLRYYEERGFLEPRRTPNGYRDYTETDVPRAALVSSLIRSGLPTKLINPLLGWGGADDGRDLTDLLAAESARLQERIACLTLSRNTIEAHLRGQRGLPPEAESVEAEGPEAEGAAPPDPRPADAVVRCRPGGRDGTTRARRTAGR